MTGIETGELENVEVIDFSANNVNVDSSNEILS